MYACWSLETRPQKINSYAWHYVPENSQKPRKSGTWLWNFRKKVYLTICWEWYQWVCGDMGQFQHGSKWLGTLTSPILLILGPDVPPRELFKTPKNFRPRTPRGGAMPFSKFGDLAKPCTFFFKYLSIYLAGNDKLGING